MGRSLPEDLRVGATPTTKLRMMPGIYNHRITAEAAEGFCADTWKVAPEADRIGYRFRGGKPLAFVEREQPFGAGSDPSNIVASSCSERDAAGRRSSSAFDHAAASCWAIMG